MFVVKDVAVLNASAGFTPGRPSDSGSDPCDALEDVEDQHRADAENASSETVYPDHRCSTVGVDARGAVDEALHAAASAAT